jgi:hypothetical protein
MRKILPISLLSLLVANNANALYLRNLDEDISPFNAQLVCDASNNCVLSPLSGDTIDTGNDNIHIYYNNDIKSLTFDSGDVDNPYSITGNRRDYGVLGFNFGTDAVITDVNIVADITNTYYSGKGINFYGANYDNINITGDITAGMGLELYNTTVDNLIYRASSNGIVATRSGGIYLRPAHVNNMEVYGDINAKGAGIDIYYGSNMGSVKVVGDITSGNNGVAINANTMTGGFNLDGNITAGYYGLQINKTELQNGVYVSGNITADRYKGFSIDNATISGGIDVLGDITAKSKDYYAVEISGTTTIDGDVNLTGNISGGKGDIKISDDTIINGTLKLSGAERTSLINGADITSTTGAAITFVNKDADNILDYSGAGVLSGSTYSIDMGEGYDILNLTGTFVLPQFYNGIEEINIIKGNLLAGDMLALNSTTAMLDLTDVKSMDINNFSINTTDEILLGNSSKTFVIADYTEGADISTLAVSLNGVSDNYGGFVYTSGNQLLFEYGDKSLNFTGTETASMDLGVTCADGTCEANLIGNAIQGGVSGSVINISDVAEADGVNEFVLGNSDASAKQFEIAHFDDTPTNYINLSGDNYMNFTNNVDFSHWGDRNSRVVDFVDGFNLHGDYVQNGDIMTDGYAIYGNGSINIYGDLILNGKIASENYGAYLRGDFNLHGELVVNGDIDAVRSGLYIASISNLNAMTVNSDVYSTEGFAVGLLSSTLSDFTNNGSITSLGNDGIYIINTTFTGDVINKGSIVSDTQTAVSSSNSNINGSFINDGTIEGSRYGVSLYNTNVGNDVINNGTIISGSYGLYQSGGSTVGSFINNGDIETDSYSMYLTNTSIGEDVINTGNISSNNGRTIYIRNTDISGNVLVSGDLTSYTSDIFHMDGGELFGSAIFNADMKVKGEDTSFANISFDETNIHKDVINKGDLYGYNDGLKFNSRSFTDNTVTGNIINEGNIYSEHRSMFLMGYNVNGDIINSGKMIASNDWENGGGGAEPTYSMLIMESDINYIKNTKTGTMQGEYGIGLATEHYNGERYRRTSNGLTNDTELTVINNGSIVGTVYDAIAFDVGAEHGTAASFDNVLNYSGSGTLSGARYDINMGDGNDTLNIVNADMKFPVINSVETVNISNSTINLVLNSDNMNSALISSPGVTSLSLSNTDFSVEGGYNLITGFKVGDTLVVAEANTITTDLSTLTLDINNYNSDGTLTIFNDGSNDQLIYTFTEVPTFDDTSGEINPGKGAQVDLASNGVFQSSVTSATSASAAVLDVVQGRQMARKYDDILSENSQLASLDAIIMSDAGNVFRIEEENKEGVWMQLTSQKDSYDGSVKAGGISSTGYDADSFGITVGYDQKLSKELLAGISLTYSTGEAEGDGNSFETDSKSTQLSFYGSYLMDDRTFVDAIVGYGIGSYEQKRNTGSDIAKADYDSTQISAWQLLVKC